MVVKKASSKKTVEDDEDEGFPETWAPVKTGESLTGTIFDKESGIETEYKDNAKVVRLQDEDGEKWTVWISMDLRRKLWRAYEVGDEVTITYTGKKGRMKTFDVIAPGDEGEEEEEDEDEEE